MTTLDLRTHARGLMPVVPDLPELRDLAIGTWKGRMVNEHGSARVFEALAQQLRSASFDEALAVECERFADEERMHGALCGAVVEALGGKAVAPALPDEVVPRHEDVDAHEAVLRNLLSVSCLSETVAVALIGAERIEMPDGALRELLTRIYADEVGHARFGWRIVQAEVPRLSAEAKRRLSLYLRVAFGHLERHELSHLPPDVCPPPEGVALGLCSGSAARDLFYSTVTDVIVPRLEALGLEAGRAYRTRLAA